MIKWFKCEYFMVLLEQVTYVSKGDKDGMNVLFVYLKDGQIKQTIYQDAKKMDGDYANLILAWSSSCPTYQCDVFTVALGAVINVGRTIASPDNLQGVSALYLDFLGGRSAQTNFEGYERLDVVFSSLVENLEKNSGFVGKLI